MGVTIYSPSSIPIFLNSLDCSGPGPVLPVTPSQIKFFDVYYSYEPAVGVHVIGGDPCSAPVSLNPCQDVGCD